MGKGGGKEKGQWQERGESTSTRLVCQAPVGPASWCEKWKQKLNEILSDRHAEIRNKKGMGIPNGKGEWVMRGGSAKKGFDR